MEKLKKGVMFAAKRKKRYESSLGAIMKYFGLKKCEEKSGQ